ncbi:MAG: sulfurtransferase TusA family protein, partial [Nitrospirales bacterium]
AVLVTEGLDPSTDDETFAEFETRMVGAGRFAADYQNLAAQIGDLGTKETSHDFAQVKIEFARRFVEACRKVTEQVGQDLTPGSAESGSGPADAAEGAATPAQAAALSGAKAEAPPILDLRGVMCPLNYVKTKLRLEMMDEGERLEVWLDAGDPIKNVPMSLRNDGHTILAEEPLEAETAHFRVLVQKVEG